MASLPVASRFRVRPMVLRNLRLFKKKTRRPGAMMLEELGIADFDVTAPFHFDEMKKIHY